MATRILYIVVGAVIVFGLLFLLWSWLFNNASTSQQNTGTFGVASSTNQYAGSSGGTNGNGESSLNGSAGSSNTAANGNIPLGENGSGSGSSGSSSSANGGIGSTGISAGGTGGLAASGNGTSGSGAFGTTTGVEGVDWLGGSSGSDFNATGINSVSSSVDGSAPQIYNPTSGSSGISLGEALAGTAIAGSLSCALQSGAIAFLSTGLGASTGVGVTAGAAGVTTGVPVSDALTHSTLAGIATLQAAQTSSNINKNTTTFLGCITNTIAKAALQQITLSVVNWINSGFNGQPAFVNDYNQFFTNVADAAAGQFIQGSGLAFLCSPFQLQIKIAIAQAYANRNAQSCTLSGVINNVNNFMNGAFSAGGWPGFISFTSVPTNNPYGAFAYAQVGLATAQSTAANNAKNNISPTGFINLEQLNCPNNPSLNGTFAGGSALGVNPQAAIAGGKASLPAGCTAKVVTPGSVIANDLGAVNKSGVDQLGIGNDIDQIINALTTQLITKTLYSGLTSLSQPATEDTGSESADNSLIADMENNISLAQQLGAVYQGSASDIEGTQSQLNDLANCWSSIASSTATSSEAATNAQNAQAQISTLQPQVDAFNDDITNVNNQIATLEQFITEATEVGSATDVQNLTTSYNAAVASDGFPAASDVTTAQQNRTTLQGQLATINSATAASMQECQADEQS